MFGWRIQIINIKNHHYCQSFWIYIYFFIPAVLFCFSWGKRKFIIKVTKNWAVSRIHVAKWGNSIEHKRTFYISNQTDALSFSLPPISMRSHSNSQVKRNNCQSIIQCTACVYRFNWMHSKSKSRSRVNKFCAVSSSLFTKWQLYDSFERRRMIRWALSSLNLFLYQFTERIAICVNVVSSTVGIIFDRRFVLHTLSLTTNQFNFQLIFSFSSIWIYSERHCSFLSQFHLSKSKFFG